MSTSTATSSVAETDATGGSRPSFDESTLPLEATGKDAIKLPFRGPAPAAARPSPAPLTAEQAAKYKQMLDAVLAWKALPVSASAAKARKGAAAAAGETAPLADLERMWLTRECLLRYLRATKWSVADALQRLEKTLVWRRQYGVDTKLTPEYISVELETGKMVVQGFDNCGRPCIYMDPSKQNTQKSPRQVESLVFLLERMINLMEPAQESMALLANFKTTKLSQAPGVGQAKETLDILQDHYPERLGRAMVINIPFFLNGFFKLITPFIDPVTREKLKFNENLRNHVPPSQLLESFNGDVNFEYDHAVYWPAFIALTNQKREQYMQRWIKGGKRIGENELYLQGGNEKSISEMEASG
ncbi:hypothetical protein KEM52_004747 [Ascosphaera acerosa]|nr:hypothetical protein KEM52_004747 [Ascosphaera acerosa]